MAGSHKHALSVNQVSDGEHCIVSQLRCWIYDTTPLIYDTTPLMKHEGVHGPAANQATSVA